jgi:hypothetical protein
MGLRDIWARSLEAGRQQPWPGGGETNLIKPDAWPPSHQRGVVFADARSIAQESDSSAVQRFRFMIKADDERFNNVVAHFA